MWKPVIVATAALPSPALRSCMPNSVSAKDGNGDGPRFEHRHRLSPEDRAAFIDARIAALKAGLELTPDQAKNWPAFEQALRDMAQAARRAQSSARGAEQNPGQAPPRRSTGWQSGPTTWPRPAPPSSTSPRPASRSIRASTTRRKSALRSSHGCCGRIIICTSARGARPGLARRQWLRRGAASAVADGITASASARTTVRRAARCSA